MVAKKSKIEGTPEAWESGALGRDEDFIKVSSDIDNAAIDEALELQMISIRLQKSLIEDMKMIAQIRGLSYQPLIRQILKRFVDCEKKQLLRERFAASEKEALEPRARSTDGRISIKQA